MPSAAVISEQPLHAARRMLERGRANLPIVVATAPIAADDPDALFFYAKTDEAGFHRLWAAALFHRALDGYDATLQLWESALDTEARAHCRIAFEHLLSFAWVLADDGDITRALRIARYGTGFVETQMREMARWTNLCEPTPYQVGLNVKVDLTTLTPPLNPGDLCGLLDSELLPRLQAVGRMSNSFSAWYSYLYRGASAFVHPSPAGIAPLLERGPRTLQIAPSRSHAPRLVEVVAEQLRSALLIAASNAAWLIEDVA